MANKLKLFAIAVAALATSGACRADDARASCPFEKTIIIGASISANTMQLMGPLASIAFGEPIQFGESPADLFLRCLSGAGTLLNLSAKFGNPSGSEQIVTLFGERRDELDESTAIVGIDAFYWDASWKYQSAPARVAKLIAYAAQKRKILVLGTVPLENPDHVKWERIAPLIKNMLAARGQYFWVKPDEEIAGEINTVLREQWLPAQGCFTIDLASMAKTLNAGGALSLADGSGPFGLYQMRPDGVHLSPQGSEYVAQRIAERLRAKQSLFRGASCGLP